MNQYKILICGAGPTGLMMAAQLLAQKVPFTIIDKKTGPTNLSKAVGVQARSLEIFEDIDLVNDLLEKGVKLKGITFFEDQVNVGHISFDGLDSKYSYVLSLPQEETEKILANHLIKHEQEILWQHELLDLQISDQEAVATIKNPQGSTYESHFDYVLGCDGIHSVVREKTGINFIGSSLEETFALADIEINPTPNKEEGSIYSSKKGSAIFFPLPSNRYRLILNNVTSQKGQEVSEEFFETYMKDRTGTDYKIQNYHWGSHFHIHYKKASTFFYKRVFLLGDAGHVHSPAGGQGMNTGLQDAYNLGWRLGFVIRQGCRESLLNDYSIEREYTADELLQMTKILTKIVLSIQPFARALRKFLLFKLLSIPVLQKKLKDRMAQLSINYSSLPTVYQKNALPLTKASIAFNAGPKAGFRAVNGNINSLKNPDISTLYDFMKGPTHGYVLIFLTDTKPRFWVLKQLENLARRFRDGNNRLFASTSMTKYVLITRDEDHALKDKWDGEVLLDKDGSLHEKYGALLPCIYAIRPDKYIHYKSQNINLIQLTKHLMSYYKFE